MNLKLGIPNFEIEKNLFFLTNMFINDFILFLQSSARHEAHHIPDPGLCPLPRPQPRRQPQWQDPLCVSCPGIKLYIRNTGLYIISTLTHNV